MVNFNFVDKVKNIKDSNNNNVVDSADSNWSTQKISNSDRLLYNECCIDIYAGDVIKGKVKEKWFNKDNRKKEIENKQGDKVVGYDFSRITPDKTRKSIVIILESPHTDEYSLDDKWNKVTPAIGSTGTKLQNNVDKLIEKVCKDYPKGTKYQIVLMNSIQFQCSLGISPLDEKVRDCVFSEIWKSDTIRNDFKDRLKSYNPKCILNLCTTGEVKPSLNYLVQALINEIYYDKKRVELYIGYHPSHWISDNSKKVWNARKPYLDAIDFK